MKLKKNDYECRACGYILSDEEKDYNDGICNCCLMDSREEDYHNKYDKKNTNDR